VTAWQENCIKEGSQKKGSYYIEFL